MDAIKLTETCYAIGGRKILGPISWRVQNGGHAAVLGPNGCGKSTLLRLLLGYYFPMQGSVRVLGETFGDAQSQLLRRRIGFVDPSGPFAPDERQNVLEVVLTGFFGHLCIFYDEPSIQQRRQAQAALDQVGLVGLANRDFRACSTGEQRRILLARALVNQPQMLVLDEPTAGLDILSRETFLATLDALCSQRRSMTVLLVTHHIEELLPRTDEVLLLSQGQATASGAPNDVLSEANVSRAFECPIQIGQANGRWCWAVEPRIWKSLLGSDQRHAALGTKK